MNLIKKNCDDLEKAIRAAFKDKNIEGFNFFQIYLKPASLKEKIKQEKKGNDLYCPFILIRPLDSTQKTINGDFEKKTKFLIRIGLENAEYNDGFFEITEIAEYIISFFSDNPSAVMKERGYTYSLDVSEIKSGLNEELTGGDYWFYDIFIDVNIPTFRHIDYLRGR